MHGLSCPSARGIFLDQGLNPCPLHWQADSQPLDHQGGPFLIFFFFVFSHTAQLAGYQFSDQGLNSDYRNESPES